MKINLDKYRTNKYFKTILTDIMYRDPNKYSVQQYHFTHRDAFLYIDFNERTGLYQLIGSHFSIHSFEKVPRSNDYLYMTSSNLLDVVKEFDNILFYYMEYRRAMY